MTRRPRCIRREAVKAWDAGWSWELKTEYFFEQKWSELTACGQPRRHARIERLVEDVRPIVAHHRLHAPVDALVVAVGAAQRRLHVALDALGRTGSDWRRSGLGRLGN